MAKQAKLALGLDLRQFKAGIADAKKAIEGLEDAAGKVSVGTGGAGAAGGAGRGVGGGGGGGSFMGGMTSGPMKLLGMLGLSVGIQQAFSRSLMQSQSGLGLRALTGGAILNDRSRYGFTRQERYERGTQVAKQAGRALSEQELSRFVETSEKMQRAFGISGEEYAGTMGAARRAGVRDQDKFISSSIGDAVASGLSGSAVGEYLSQMTSYLETMSKGIDIDESSLRGMAGALGQMDFFKRDPSRIFDALRGIEAAFKDADPYQQYLSYRSISAAGGGKISPAGVEMRRQMPLFGEIDDKTAQALRDAGMGAVADVMGISGSEMARQRAIQAFQDANLSQESMTPEQQLIRHQQFSAAMGLSDQQAAPMIAQMRNFAKGGKNIKDFNLTTADEEAMKDAMKTADQLAKDNMKSFQGKVVVLGERLDNLKNVLSDFVTKGVDAFVGAVDAFSNYTGLFQSDVSKLLAGLGVAAGVGGVGSAAGSFLGSAAGGALAGGGMAGLGFLGAAGAVVSAAAAGALIGKGIRDQLEESFDWNNKVSGFWNGAIKAFGGEGEDTGYMDLENSLSQYGEGGRKAQVAYSKGARSRGFNLSPEGVKELIDRERRAVEKDSGLNLDEFREKELEKFKNLNADLSDPAFKLGGGGGFIPKEDRSKWFAPMNVTPINEAKPDIVAQTPVDVATKSDDIEAKLPTGTGDSITVISDNTIAIRQLTNVLMRLSNNGGANLRVGKGNK